MTLQKHPRPIILVIDAGSSSIRCKGYEFDFEPNSHDDQCNENNANATDPLTHTIGNKPTSSGPIRPLEGIIHTIQMASVIPNTGYIRIHDVLEAIDECIDAVLRLLRGFDPNSQSNESIQTFQPSFQVIAIGFSTFVMNLIGVDEEGKPVGETATMSYACNRKEVVRECQLLRDDLGPEKVNSLYQRTGAPIHPAYALPQLLAFYKNTKDETVENVHRWTTISSICLHRWVGMKNNAMDIPLSYSEGSWTGMMNFRTCTWDEEVLDILKSRIPSLFGNLDGEQSQGDQKMATSMDFLPSLVDYDGTLARGCIFPPGEEPHPANDWISLVSKGITSTRVDGTSNPYWERWPELRGGSFDKKEIKTERTVMGHCQLFLGVGDGAAANVGSKCGGRDSVESFEDSNMNGFRIAVTIGTSAAARVCLNFPLVEPGEKGNFKSTNTFGKTNDFSVPAGLFCYRVDRERVLLGGALTDGGSVVEWARSLLNLQSKDSFDECLAKVSDLYRIGGNFHELTMLPFLSGERSTGFRGGAQACLSGMTRETKAHDVMHACLEGVVLRLGAILDLMNKVFSSLLAGSNGKNDFNNNTILVASGNALERNALWRQMLADCAGLDLVVDADSSEGTCRGVAFLVGKSLQRSMCLNCDLSFEEDLSVVSKAQANLQASSKWTKASLNQESFIDAMSPLWIREY